MEYIVLAIFVASWVIGTFLFARKMKQDFDVDGSVDGSEEIGLSILAGGVGAIATAFLSVALYTVPAFVIGAGSIAALVYLAAKKGLGL